jgi:hypothetical protein
MKTNGQLQNKSLKPGYNKVRILTHLGRYEMPHPIAVKGSSGALRKKVCGETENFIIRLATTMNCKMISK